MVAGLPFSNDDDEGDDDDEDDDDDKDDEDQQEEHRKKSHGKHLNFFWNRLCQNPEMMQTNLLLQPGAAAWLPYNLVA
jgi:ABC-type Zn2+ transport system substrate-binding protein/surface adhesin